MITREGFEKIEDIKSWVEGLATGHMFEMNSPTNCVLGQYTVAKDITFQTIGHHFSPSDTALVKDLFAYEHSTWHQNIRPPLYQKWVTKEQWLAVYNNTVGRFSNDVYLLLCKVLEEHYQITTLPQLGAKMCELGYGDVCVTQGNLDMAFGYIAQFREVEAPIWSLVEECSE